MPVPTLATVALVFFTELLLISLMRIVSMKMEESLFEGANLMDLSRFVAAPISAEEELVTF